MSVETDSHYDPLLARFGRHFEAGDVVFEQGSPAKQAHLLQTGKVRLVRQSGTHERTLRVANPGHLIGESALLQEGHYTSTAIAIGSCATLALDSATFEQVVASSPSVGIQLIRQLVVRVAEVEDQLDLYVAGSEPTRVVLGLLQLCQREAVMRAGIPQIALSPLELGARVGLDVGTVRRQVQQLRDNGYVRIVDEQLHVTNLDGLRELHRLLEMGDELRTRGAFG